MEDTAVVGVGRFAGAWVDGHGADRVPDDLGVGLVFGLRRVTGHDGNPSQSPAQVPASGTLVRDSSHWKVKWFRRGP
jgi:hypothetical protein